MSSSLDARLDERRRRLRLRWRDLADRSGVSAETIRLLRRGARDESVRATDTERKLEDALGWGHGSIQAIRDGGEPTLSRAHPGPLRAVEPSGIAEDYPEEVGDDPFLRRIWDDPAPEDERRAAVQGVLYYREALRRVLGEGAGSQPARRHDLPGGRPAARHDL